MRDQPLPPGRRFAFEVELEISPALCLAPGELGSLLVDGLFTLDDEDRLFPGVTFPGVSERILSASTKSSGYSRYSKPAWRPIPSRPDSGQATPARSEEDDAIHANLSNAFYDIEKVLAEQRMLIAKIRGLEDILRGTGPLSDADRADAQKLLRACAALVRHHKRSIKPAL